MAFTGWTSEAFLRTVKELTSARRAVENEAAASAEEALAAQEHVEELEMQQQVRWARGAGERWLLHHVSSFYIRFSFYCPSI